MPQLTTYAKQRIVALKQTGADELTSTDIHKILLLEGVRTTPQTIRFLMRYCKTNSINRASGSGHLSKLTEDVLRLIDVEMKKNDETTATTLCTFFLQHGLEISIRTILRGRKQLGWSYCGSAYCQLIWEPNNVKRKDWALKYLHDDFQNVVWTDETTVQLECHKRFCCRKNRIHPQYKPHPKHPIKMHVWAGISWEGPTPVCIFEEIMNAKL